MRDDEQYDVEQAIHALLRDHPDLVLTHTWTEGARILPPGGPPEARYALLSGREIPGP